MRILLIEDNTGLVRNLYDYLEARGHELDHARDGVTGLHLAVTQPWDAVVLDLTLPGLDGLEVCRQLREHAGAHVPVLMLTARDAVPERVRGLEAGADDYLVKPFAMAELAARLDALVRRARAAGGPVLEVADLRYDVTDARATRAGRPLTLTPSELRVLEVLMRASPRLVRRAALEDVLWPDIPPDSDALRTHIHGLRRALDRPFDRPLLHTVRGLGWRLAADETSDTDA